MRSTSPIATTSAIVDAAVASESQLSAAAGTRLIAHDDGLLASRLFIEPVDVSLLEELQVDELGRRSRWLPSDVLL